MRVPILVGWSEKVERTGETFQAQCPECHGEQRFHVAKKAFNVSAFVAVSLWDSEEPVVQCSTCLHSFDPEDITPIAAPAPAPSLRERIAGAFTKAAPAGAAPTGAERAKSEDDEIAAELAAMKKRLKR